MSKAKDIGTVVYAGGDKAIVKTCADDCLCGNPGVAFFVPTNRALKFHFEGDK